MSNLKFGPKIIPLGEEETLASIERFKQNMLYHLRLNEEFRRFLNTEFGKKCRTSPCRSLTDDTKVETVKNEGGEEEEVLSVVLSKEDQCFTVDLLLDQIANFSPLIPRNDITRDSCSLQEVWQKIRLYHNLEKSGALMNECWSIKRKPDESPQALFARLKQCYDDNLIPADSLHHVGGVLQEDEEMSPSLHNTVILHWLQLLHPQLRETVTTRFSTQLRNCTYAALFPEISRSVNPLLEELNGDTATNRVFTNKSYQPSYPNKTPYRSSSRSYVRKSCDYCKMTGKKAYQTHSMDDCLWIKREMSKSNTTAKQVECDNEESDDLHEQYEEYYRLTGEVPDHEASRVVEHIINTISINASPVLTLQKDKKSYPFVLDTGCTGSIVDEDTAVSLNATIKPTCQRARTADGKLMRIIGEIEVVLHRNSKPYHLVALVCSDQTDLLAGMPFMKRNDIAVRPATDEIIIDGKEFLKYDPIRKLKHSRANRVTQFTVQSDVRQVILPGETGTFSVYGLAGNEEKIVVEPRWDSYCNKKATKYSELWPSPKIVQVHNGSVHLTNESMEPIVVKRTEHVGQIQPQVVTDFNTIIQGRESSTHIDTVTVPMKKTCDFSASVGINPDKTLSTSDECAFNQLLKTYDEVFSPVTSTYNGKMGACFVEVNMGQSLPPQKKGRVPFYSRDNLETLQEKFDELEKKGVFSRPQDIGITVENTNPSFLVNKQQSSEKRLVTDFSSISEYCRPTPSLLPNVDSTLRNVGTWKFIIKSDMSSAYHQIPLKKTSKKFCGVHTPYKGLRVYNVGCMGLPGVEIALEELTCLLLGDLVKENKVAKLADDLFIGGDTPEELLLNFEQVLHRLLESNIKLSPTKTIIAPKSITLLGWIWSSGQLRASPHRLSALSTCSPPDTVSALKSYLGAYRFLSRVLPRYAKSLIPLESAIRGKTGKEKVEWSSSLQEAFHKAQQTLLDAKTITVPIPSDTLWIVTDAAVRPFAIGATLYTVRNGKALLSGFFNSKLPEFQTRWLPCEVEGMAVAASLNHYAPLIIQSHEKPQVLTDSKACVQAVQKLRRGEFSTSARLTAFLSSVSRYNAQIQHISGAVNLPSDYASRHPLTCSIPESCQVCKFITEVSEGVVNEVSITDIIDGKLQLPYTNRASWKTVQSECPDLRKVLAHKKNGTMPNRKSKNLRRVRKYLSSNILVSADGLLVHRLVKPLVAHDQIVVPEQVVDGLLTALHLKLQHPTSHQLTQMFSRYFYILNLETSVSAVSKSCYHCASIREVPKSLIEQSTSDPPSNVGSNYAADIIKRCKQLIFVIRETTTSYTLAEHIQSETAKEVTSIMIKLCNILKPSKLSPIKVKLDPAPAHKSMFLQSSNDSELTRNNISLELGRSVNPNKNPIIDKCIKELHREILNIKPSGGSITPLQLSEAVASLNGRIRSPGMSSHELWTQRDQVSGDQLPLNDMELIIQQYQRRSSNHQSSEKSKAGNRPTLPSPKVKVGSLVYIHTDRDKTEARQRYMVTDINAEGYKLRKFTSRLFSKQVYDVKPNEIYIVSEYLKEPLPELPDDSSDDEFHQAVSEIERNHHRNQESADSSVPVNSDSEESAGDEEVRHDTSQSSSDEDIQLPGDPAHQQTIPHLVPPVELTNPADKRMSVGISGRLRKRQEIDYNESEEEDT